MGERADKEERNFAEFVWSMAKKLVCPPWSNNRNFFPSAIFD
jgi:hypothetical protein